ncbi:MAG: RNA polymerase sigma factor RpoD/SigA [Nannocystales bacterium]
MPESYAREVPRSRNQDRPLDAYFDDMSSTQRLSADEELDLARRLTGAKASIWTCLLQAPDKVLRKEIKAVLGDKAPPLRKRGDQWPQSVRDALVAADRDCEVARRLTAWVHTHPECGVNGMELQASINRARQLRDQFVAANLGLVVSIARRYERRLFSFSDLIQEGNTGLLKAVDRFDPDRGFRFSTYAVWWIRHAIGRALSDRGREIRLPVHVAERQQTLVRARVQFESQQGRPATPEELAECTGFTVERVRRLLAVEYTRAIAHDPTTKTSQPVLVEELPIPCPEYEEALDATAWSDGLREAVGSLPVMQQEIIRQRFGLDGSAPMTLREVGKLHDLSRERIRQIQVTALNRMRETFAGRGLVA